MNIIKLGQQIPNTTYKIKKGPEYIIKNTREEFKDKKILILGIPGAFVSDYPSNMLAGYEYNFKKIIALGIDDIYCTTVHDYYVMRQWFKSESIEQIKLFPDGNAQWAEQVGFDIDMSDSYMGTRSHRYAMLIDNNHLKRVFYEDFTHDPHTCFTETNAEKIIDFLEKTKNTWEKF